MPTIRGFVLDGVALAGAVAGVAAGVGGYCANLPDPPERVAVAAAYAEPDPETTGAITPRDAAAATRPDTVRSGDAAAVRSRAEGEVRVWVDPPRRSGWSGGE